MTSNVKKYVFRLMALLLPFLFLAAVETILRLSDSFTPVALFLPVSQNGVAHYQVNPDAAQRYFSASDASVPRLYPQTFPVKKPRNSIRIVCLGGSTTAGFPFEYNATFPEQLRFLLQDRHPGFDFEVINLGLSAVNSFTVWDWAEEIAEKANPDIVLIYMGHNEYYGAYGSASSIAGGSFPRLTRLVLKAKSWHIVNMLDRILGGGKNSDRIKDMTLMEQVIADASISYGSDIFHRTHSAYRDNLQDIIDVFKENNSRIVISTLVSNLLDQRPFDGSWFNDGDSIRAFDLWLQGRELAFQGNLPAARRFLEQARDYDLVRFRAAGELNEIVEELSFANALPVVAMDSVFSAESRVGVAGDDLFCDHLHPNIHGYYLMARAFYEKIRRSQWISASADTSALPDSALYVTPVDHEIGLLRVHRLKQRPPFRPAGSEPRAYQPYADSLAAAEARRFIFEHHNWVKSHYFMADAYAGRDDGAKACAEYEAVSRVYDNRIEPLRKLLDCYRKEESWSRVEQTASRMLELTTDQGLIFQDMAVAQWNRGKFVDAVNTIQKAIVAPEMTQKQRGRAKYILAQFLFSMRRTQDAQNVLQDALKDDPGLR